MKLLNQFPLRGFSKVFLYCVGVLFIMNVLILSQSFKKYQETIGVINIRLSILIIATDDKKNFTYYIFKNYPYAIMKIF